jgi:hypothetical protein
MVLMEAARISPRLRRWLWFGALYAASVVTLATVAYGLRALIKVFM